MMRASSGSAGLVAVAAAVVVAVVEPVREVRPDTVEPETWKDELIHWKEGGKGS